MVVFPQTKIMTTFTVCIKIKKNKKTHKSAHSSIFCLSSIESFCYGGASTFVLSFQLPIPTPFLSLSLLFISSKDPAALFISSSKQLKIFQTKRRWRSVYCCLCSCVFCFICVTLLLPLLLMVFQIGKIPLSILEIPSVRALTQQKQNLYSFFMISFLLCFLNPFAFFSVFKHKFHYELFIFRDQRAFDLCNYTHATLLTKPNSTSFMVSLSLSSLYFLWTSVRTST